MHGRHRRPADRRGAPTVRQWVLSLPFEMRYRLSWDGELVAANERDGREGNIIFLSMRISFFCDCDAFNWWWV